MSRGPSNPAALGPGARRRLCPLRSRRGPDAQEPAQHQVDCFAPEWDEWLDAAANARLVKNAEAYYRVMYHGSAESWNLRDTHMFDTLEHDPRAKGPKSKAIVWAHNSHIGNAAFTDMGMAATS